MRTYGLGWDAQIRWDLAHAGHDSGPCCTCHVKGKSGTHAIGCEQGILLAGRKPYDLDNRGKPKKKKR